MPSTRTGRQSSPSKRDESPSKTRFQPMRGARLRSASPFFDTASALTSAAASKALQSSQTSSPSKSARSSPRKKVAAATASLQPSRRSTRSRSRSVDPESLSAIDEHSSSPLNRDVSEMPDSEKEVAQSNSVRLDSAYTNNDEGNASPEPQLAPIFEEATYTSASLAATEAESDEGAPSSSSSSSSESDSDSGASSDSDDSSSESSSEDEQEDDPATHLDALLKASQQAYKSRAPAPADQSRFEDNQDVISFDALTDGLQSSKRPSKAIPLVVKAKHQVAKTQPAASKGQGSSKDKLDKQIEALDQGALASEKKKSKHARTVQTSTGSSWFDMPEFGASASRLAALKKQSTADKGHSKATGGDARLASAEQLRREVQALRLRNALDPKRFYRSSAKNQAMPKFAQLGKIIASPLEPKAVMSRQERGRTVVEELIRDADAASYAKRKFSESQASHRSNYNGRRKPPSKKKRT
ncbi:hypothetical protein NDA11_001816 [Ustilago hordei]|uniref:Fcf2 pre-rRNA processing C-terminal domain-containing protein n=1 Tax=Ustilago hordei TaxID=120017 RepID=I2G668_USTHO|nr:uncharacterized protein UHO2_02007 [Ustilago hordei]KAJ1039106.1 hypothetical protein NDA10_003354 [Ustilago hordei]KAJ1585887.1 hypothetical protein NDA12_002859 [Ustilago hordei]KAJ1589523.1 hypothetical protein NDA15_006202 [Ustilago hordei]KAJ1590698.1 hypothetical protein NDA11_001816 [Ustilago hordei]KAJ1601105.1 hypothetical protein NDA14_007106 [Ustilago hordei]